MSQLPADFTTAQLLQPGELDSQRLGGRSELRVALLLPGEPRCPAGFVQARDGGRRDGHLLRRAFPGRSDPLDRLVVFVEVTGDRRQGPGRLSCGMGGRVTGTTRRCFSRPV